MCSQPGSIGDESHRKSPKKIRTRSLGLFQVWRHKLFCMHVYEELMLCKWIYDVNPAIDPGLSQARSCEFSLWFSVTLTAHKIWSFQEKQQFFHHFAHKTTKMFLSRKTFWGVIGTLSVFVQLLLNWLWRGWIIKTFVFLRRASWELIGVCQSEIKHFL